MLQSLVRCQPRPTLVELPVPSTSGDTGSILQVIPGHVMLDRCSGSCRSPSHSCLPTHVENVTLEVRPRINTRDGGADLLNKNANDDSAGDGRPDDLLPGGVEHPLLGGVGGSPRRLRVRLQGQARALSPEQTDLRLHHLPVQVQEPGEETRETYPEKEVKIGIYVLYHRRK